MIYSKGRIDMATIFPREEKAEMLFDSCKPGGMQATEKNFL